MIIVRHIETRVLCCLSFLLSNRDYIASLLLSVLLLHMPCEPLPYVICPTCEEEWKYHLLLQATDRHSLRRRTSVEVETILFFLKINFLSFQTSFVY